MVLSCSVIIKDAQERADFCKRLRSLGGIPCEINKEVVLLYAGDEETMGQLIQLVEEYPDHKVQISHKSPLF